MDLLDFIESKANPDTEPDDPPVDVMPMTKAVDVSDVTDADIFDRICDILEKVWLVLTDDMQHVLTPEQIPEWVQTLEWAIKVMPAGYEKQREIIANELREYQPMRKAKTGTPNPKARYTHE